MFERTAPSKQQISDPYPDKSDEHPQGGRNGERGMGRIIGRKEVEEVKEEERRKEDAIPSVCATNGGALVVLLDLGDTLAVEDLGLWQVLQQDVVERRAV